MKHWSLIFSSILISCGSKADDSASDMGESVVDTCDGVECYGECLYPYERTEEFTLTAEEFATYLEEDGTLSAEGCANICIDQAWDTLYQGLEEVLSCVDEPVDGNALVTCEMMLQPYCEGRFHDGVPRPKQQEGTRIQQWFSRAAQSERASVQSFVLLAKELEFHCAPQHLIDRLIKAAREEVSHARMMHHLCTKHDAKIPQFEDSTLPQRTLFDIAIENAVEGCVHERYAALQAHHQAIHAQDEQLRAIFSQIAHEETEHTALADELHSWFMSQLSEQEQECVRQAKKAAQNGLEKALLAREDTPDMMLYLGLPRAKRAHALAQQLHTIAA